jgi:hypothetical protein
VFIEAGDLTIADARLFADEILAAADELDQLNGVTPPFM